MGITDVPADAVRVPPEGMADDPAAWTPIALKAPWVNVSGAGGSNPQAAYRVGQRRPRLPARLDPWSHSDQPADLERRAGRAAREHSYRTPTMMITPSTLAWKLTTFNVAVGHRPSRRGDRRHARPATFPTRSSSTGSRGGPATPSSATRPSTRRDARRRQHPALRPRRLLRQPGLRDRSHRPRRASTQAARRAVWLRARRPRLRAAHRGRGLHRSDARLPVHAGRPPADRRPLKRCVFRASGCGCGTRAPTTVASSGWTCCPTARSRWRATFRRRPRAASTCCGGRSPCARPDPWRLRHDVESGHRALQR